MIPKTAGVSDCQATAYPKYIETPVVEVPMPKKLSSVQLVKQLISYHKAVSYSSTYYSSNCEKTL